jgi:hypothetical protein
MKENKRTYTAPSMERIPVEPGNDVMAVSGNGLTDFGGEAGSSLFETPTVTSTRRRTFAGQSDVESMINDILTVGQ